MTLATSMNAFISVGIGSAAPAPTDNKLGFEVARAEITNSSYDAATRTVMYKATLPSDAEFSMSEVALVASGSTATSGGLLTAFDQTIEEWTGGTWSESNILIGSTGLNVALGTASRLNPEGRTMPLRNSDTVQVAYFGAGGNVEIRLGNTATDYLSFTFTAQTGHNVSQKVVREMTRTGEVSLESINTITIIHSGSGSVTMDAIRVTPEADEETLVVRQKLGTSYRKVAGMPLDIEIPLVVNL